MTQNGIAFQLPTLAHRTYGTGFGLLPTPAAQESQPTPEFIKVMKENQGNTHERLYLPGRKHHAQRTLSRAVHIWPTPSAGHRGAERKFTGVRPSGAKQALTLQTAVKMWPTPKSSPSGPDFARMNREGSGGDDLATAVARQRWPTPRASEWKGTGPLGSKSHEYRLVKGYLDATVQEEEQKTGALNPMWVEWLMGFPLGWTDLDA